MEEITYAYQPEKEINEVSIQLSEKPCKNTKIVFIGSQSVALEAWANRAFCGNASVIRADFLNYSEWLTYKGIKESSEATYSQFLYEIDEFYGYLLCNIIHIASSFIGKYNDFKSKDLDTLKQAFQFLYRSAKTVGIL